MPPQPKLDLAPFTLGPVDAPIACLLIHGFAGSPPEMRPMGEYLAKHGIYVEGIRLAGHGTDSDALSDLTWMDWLHSAREGLKRISENRSKENVVIAGFSMGGLLGLHLCVEYPGKIGGIATFSSPVFFQTRWIHMIPIVRHIHPWHDVRRLGRHTDPEAHNRYHAYRRYPLIAVDYLLNLMRVTRKILPEVITPALIMHGMQDSVIKPKSALYLHSHISSTQKELVLWENSGHGIPFDSEREEVWARVLSFVQGEGRTE
jgi:carboxylesterase